MKRYVIHHNDADGFGGALAAWLKFGNYKTEYIAVDHDGNGPPSMDAGSEIYIIDFSYSRDETVGLISNNSKVVVIDHHESTAKKLTGLPNTVLDTSRSGATIAWDYFHDGESRPPFIDYIEDLDLDRYALPDSILVKNSIRQIPLSIDQYIKEYRKPISDRIAEGKILQGLYDYNVSRGLKYAHTIMIDNMKMTAVNTCLHISEFGDALHDLAIRDGSELCGAYHRVPEGWKFSLRPVGAIDVVSVCERMGGGGRRAGGGFTVSTSRFNGSRVDLVLFGYLKRIDVSDVYLLRGTDHYSRHMVPDDALVIEAYMADCCSGICDHSCIKNAYEYHRCPFCKANITSTERRGHMSMVCPGCGNIMMMCAATGSNDIVTGALKVEHPYGVEDII